MKRRETMRAYNTACHSYRWEKNKLIMVFFMLIHYVFTLYLISIGTCVPTVVFTIVTLICYCRLSLPRLSAYILTHLPFLLRYPYLCIYLRMSYYLLPITLVMLVAPAPPPEKRSIGSMSGACLCAALALMRAWVMSEGCV